MRRLEQAFRDHYTAAVAVIFPLRPVLCAVALLALTWGRPAAAQSVRGLDIHYVREFAEVVARLAG